MVDRADPVVARFVTNQLAGLAIRIRTRLAPRVDLPSLLHLPFPFYFSLICFDRFQNFLDVVAHNDILIMNWLKSTYVSRSVMLCGDDGD